MVTKVADREAADRVEMDNSNRHPCMLLRTMGKQTNAETVLVVEITNTVDACRMAPATMDTAVDQMEMTMTTVTTTATIKITLVLIPAGVALADMVDPVADPVADLVEDLPVGPEVDLLVTSWWTSWWAFWWTKWWIRRGCWRARWTDRTRGARMPEM